MKFRILTALMLPLLVSAAGLPQGKTLDQGLEPRPDFPFDTGKGGAMLLDALKPRLEAAPWEAMASIPELIEELTPDDLDQAPISPAVLELPQSPLKTKPAIHAKPQSITGETLPVPGSKSPVPLDPPMMPVVDRIQVDGLDIQKPLVMNDLGEPILDKVSLEDPSQEEGVMLPIPLLIEERTQGIALGRLAIPDPFENYGPVQLPIVLPELPTPPVRPIR